MAGHALRATGAQYLARCGIEYYKIQLFCRCGSDTILRYLHDAPLEESENWLSKAHQTSPMTELLCQTAVNMNSQGLVVSAKDVGKIVQAALEARATEVTDVLASKKDDLDQMIQSLKDQRIEMNLHWAGELPRRFLPKFVVNLSSGKWHAVRDSMCTGCGHEWRNAKGHDLKYEKGSDANLCDKPGCQKLLKRFD